MESIYFAVIWILILEIFSLSVFPFISSILSGITDRGFALSKIIGVLVASYIIWFISSFHILPFSRISSSSISLLILLLALAPIYIALFYKYFLKNKEISFPILNKIINSTIKLKEIKSIWKILLIEELIFLGTFALWTYIRGISPDIIGTEKFMDYGIMNSILKSTYFPPKDMWLSGFTLNYYYYGQYIYSFISSISGIGTNYTYNFSLSTIFALSLTLTFSIVYTLCKRVYAGIISMAVLGFSGNIYYAYKGLQYFITNHGNLTGFTFWYPDSTRLIPYTINEFPIYSFIVGDLHPHVTNIPIVLGALVIALNIFNRKYFRNIDLLLYAFILGMITITNTWDGIFYALILLGVLVYTFTEESDTNNTYNITSISSILEMPIFKAFFKTFLTGVIAIVMFAPYYLHFKAPIDGIGINNIAHSNIGLVLIIFGTFIFFVLTYIGILIYQYFKKLPIYSSDVFIILLVFIGFILVLTPEILYLKDIFYKANPPYFRANTVFKLYYQAWILLSISMGYIFARINFIYKEIKSGLPAKASITVWNVFAAIVFIGIFSYSYEAINQGYLNITNQIPGTNQSCITNNFCTNAFKTDNGTDYIKKDHIDDYNTINWLNKNASNNSIILEATGDSYTYYARISVNTGLQTVLGWANHEYQWRNTYAYSSERITDIKNIYEGINYSDDKKILNKYNISYIIVGKTEREKYTNINEPLLKTLGTVVYESNTSYIIQVIKT